MPLYSFKFGLVLEVTITAHKNYPVERGHTQDTDVGYPIIFFYRTVARRQTSM